MKLIAIDEMGRQQGALTLKRTWRWNDPRDCREYGYRVEETEGCDLGSARWFFRAPIGRSDGFAREGITWRVAE